VPYDTSSLFLERCHSFFLYIVHSICQITTEMKRTTGACGKKSKGRSRSRSRRVETTGRRRRRKEEEGGRRKRKEEEEEYAGALSYHISFVPQQHGR